MMIPGGPPPEKEPGSGSSPDPGARAKDNGARTGHGAGAGAPTGGPSDDPVAGVPVGPGHPGWFGGYDREGRPITMVQSLWLSSGGDPERMPPDSAGAQALVDMLASDDPALAISEERGNAYRRVAEDRVGEYRISTVWVGVDAGADRIRRAPLIFETMVFDLSGEIETPPAPELIPAVTRYPTAQDAQAGHDRVVSQIKAAHG